MRQTWCLNIACHSLPQAKTLPVNPCHRAFVLWMRPSGNPNQLLVLEVGGNSEGVFFKAYIVLQKTSPCGWFPMGAAVHIMFLTTFAMRPTATLSFLHPQTNIFPCWSLWGILGQCNHSIGWAVRKGGEADSIHFQICNSKFSLLDDQYKHQLHHESLGNCLD